MSEQNTSRGFFNRLFGGGSDVDESQKAQAKNGSKDQSLAQTSSVQKVHERKSLMRAAEDFHALRVEDVMVPRAEIIAIASDIPLQELTNSFIEAGHSRLPVYGETLDEPVGFVHVKDLLGYLTFDAPQNKSKGKKGGRSSKSYPDKKIIGKILRPVIFVPPSMAADALLKKMQVGRVHMAIVVDEYGGTDGLVTLEDLIEPIVGDIEDEHDDADPEIKTRIDKNGQSYWEADARAVIEDFEAVLGRDIATPEQDGEVATLGGLVFSLAGRVPERGEIIRAPHDEDVDMGIEFEILEADPRRVKRLRLRLTSYDKRPDPKRPDSNQIESNPKDI